MAILQRLFGGETSIPRSVPASPEERDLEPARQLIEASQHIERRFHIDVDDDDLKTALVAIGNRSALVTAFSNHDIDMLDWKAVEAYQRKRVRSTLWERFTWGLRYFSELAKDWMLYDLSGLAAAAISFCIVVPFGIPELINLLWYDVSFLPSYFLLLLIEVLSCFAILGIADEEDHFDETVENVGKAFAAIPLVLVGYPLAFLMASTASWFVRVESSREWKTMSVKDFFGKGKIPLSEAVVIMDKVLKIAPEAKLEFEALVNPDGSRTGEAFLVVDYGAAKNDTLHLWHGHM